MYLDPTALIVADRSQRRLHDSARLDTPAVEPATRNRTERTDRGRWRLAILRPRPA